MGYKFYKFDKLIVTGSGDKTIKVWSLLDFSCKKTLEGHTNSVQRVKFFNREHPQLLSCGADGLIKLWDYKQGEIIKSLDNHDQRIWAMDLKMMENISLLLMPMEIKLLDR